MVKTKRNKKSNNGTKKILKCPIGLKQFQEEFGRIIDFMNHGESSDGTETLMQIQKLDQRRQQDLKKVALELAQILHYAKT